MKFWPFGKEKIPLTVPGPSPWYLRTSSASIETTEGAWSWSFFDGPNLAGLSRLLSPGGDTVLLLDVYCYVQPLPAGRVLIWYELGRTDKEQDELPRVMFTILVLPKLIRILDPEKAANTLRERNERIRFEGGAPSIFEFSTTVGEGRYPLNTPAQFENLTEQLVLADFDAKEIRSNHFDKMHRAIFAFNFVEMQVVVLPQKWFNEGSFDFGYQWITRVQREEATGQIVGEGIRLGNFRLDPTGTQIQQWLVHDVFYHPERESL